MNIKSILLVSIAMLHSAASVAAPVSGQGTWETTLEGRLETAPGSGVFLAYYDTVLDITWAADANINGPGAWDNQVAWAAGLILGGVSGWRLPTLSPIDGSTFDTSWSNNATTDRGYAYTTTDGTDGGWRDISDTPVSEMGHMYYVTLANLGLYTPNDADPSSTVEQPGWGLINTGPFSNVQPNFYWSGMEFDSFNAWYFNFNFGYQDLDGFSSGNYAWAVRDGDVPAVVPVDPLPDIKANGSDGPLQIVFGTTLQVDVSLSANDAVGQAADWWLVAEAPDGRYWYDISGSWVKSAVPIPTYDGPLFDLAPMTVLNSSNLPVGSYRVNFGVDSNANGTLDFDVLFVDAVIVTIQ